MVPAAVYAIRKWDEWLRKYAPPGAASYDFYQSLPALSQGNVAQQIFWYTAFTASMVAPKSDGNNTGGRHHVGPRDDAREEAGVVGHLDHVRQVRPQRVAEHRRDRRRRRRPRQGVARDPVDLLRLHPVAQPAQAERLGDLLAQHRANVLSGHPTHDLREHEAPRHRVVGEQAPGPGARPLGAQDLHHVLRSCEQVEIQRARGQVRDARPVTEDVPQRDPVLAEATELGDELADPILDVERTLLVELVDHHGGDRLGGGEQAERGPRGDEHLRRVRRIVRCVARGVADGTVEEHVAAVPDGELQGRVGAGPVERFHGVPDPLDPALGKAELPGGHLVADGAHVRQVPRHATAREPGEGKPGEEFEGVHRVRSS